MARRTIGHNRSFPETENPASAAVPLHPDTVNICHTDWEAYKIKPRHVCPGFIGIPLLYAALIRLLAGH
jgi:hypothetical protein